MTMHIAHDKLELENLWSRRKKLCITFSKKTLKTRHKEMFVEQHKHYTRNKTQSYKNKANHGRYKKSPLNYLTRLLNAEKVI